MRQTPLLEFTEGDLIAGRYLVHRALAGGMGEVYLCSDQQTQARYALKTFQTLHLAHAGLREAFEAEVGVWVALETHINLVRCFWMDTLAGRPYMFLEWVDAGDDHGSDLRSLLRDGPLEPKQALELAMDICHGLKHAQDRQPGLVHRDLKPENILIAPGMKGLVTMTAKGVESDSDADRPKHLAKITDFGLAKIAGDVGLQVTSNPDATHQSMHAGGGIVGTPRYMAPEQWRGEPTDARTDIYAIGAMLYEMLCGKPPYIGMTLEALRSQHLNEPVPVPARVDIPESLSALILRCLAKDKTLRFSATTDLQQALKRIYVELFDGHKPADIVMAALFMPEDMVNRAKAYIELGRLDEAQANLDAAIKAYPDFALAYESRGVVWMNRGDTEKALDDLNNAIRLHPVGASAYSNRGGVHSGLHRSAEAMADYTRAIQLDPTFAKAWVNRGALQRWLGHDDAAQSDFDRAIELDASIGFAHQERGLIHLRHSRLEQALGDFSRAIELLSNPSQAYIARSHVLARLGRRDEALDDCDAAIRIDPTNAQAHFNRGVIQRGRGRYLDALADFGRVLELAPERGDALLNRGVLFNEVGRREDALVDLTRALALDPSSAMAYMNRGVVNDALDRDQDAIADFDRALALSPEFAAAYKNRAHRHARAGRTNIAIADLGRAIDLNPTYDAAYLLRGQLLAQLQRHPEAITDFTHAIDLNPTADAFDRRGQSHNALGRHTEAIADYTNALHSGCEDPAAVLTSRGVSRVRGDDPEGALKDFQAAIQANSQMSAPYVLIANLLVSYGQEADAIPFYTDAVRLGEAPWASKSADALRRLGVEPSD